VPWKLSGIASLGCVINYFPLALPSNGGRCAKRGAANGEPLASRATKQMPRYWRAALRVGQQGGTLRRCGSLM